GAERPPGRGPGAPRRRRDEAGQGQGPRRGGVRRGRGRYRGAGTGPHRRPRPAGVAGGSGRQGRPDPALRHAGAARRPVPPADARLTWAGRRTGSSISTAAGRSTGIATAARPWWRSYGWTPFWRGFPRADPFSISAAARANRSRAT